MADRQMYIRGTGISFQNPEDALTFGYEGCDMQAELLPAGLRRRTSVATKVAFAAAERACRSAGADPSALASVFTSSLGEIGVTDRLCGDIAHERFPVSPTQFHNSVHNTASGYWSIAVESRKPAMAMGAYHDGFALGLLEAWCQLQCGEQEILLVCYEETPAQLMLPDNHWIGCATAFVLSLEKASESQAWAIRIPFSESHNRSDDGFGAVSPALSAMSLLKAVHGGGSGKIRISPDGETVWFTELSPV